MVLSLPFVLLSVGAKLKKKNEPSTTYFLLTFKNHINNPDFEQEIKCVVTLDDIIKHSYFKDDIKIMARRFLSLPQQKGDGWLNEWLIFRDEVVAVLTANTAVKIDLSF